MKTKYFKRFAITNNLVSIEELSSIAQMQAQMDELVRYLPMPYLTDGHSFFMEEISDKEILFSDILWGESINAKRSVLHMKDGQTITIPSGAKFLKSLFYDSIETRFTQIRHNVFLSVSSIEKVSRKIVCIKCCDIQFKVSPNYYDSFFYTVYKYLTTGVKKWRVEDYVRWKSQK